jgi:hypothetical protein
VICCARRSQALLAQPWASGRRPVLGQAKKFAGVSISGAAFQSTYHEYLKAYLPEFEAETGMKVDFQQQAFPVYNITDPELSTGLSMILGNSSSTRRWGRKLVHATNDFVKMPPRRQAIGTPMTSSRTTHT